MDKILFSVGYLHFHHFGTILAIGMMCALAITLLNVHLRRQSFNVVVESFIFIIPVAILFARIFFVLTHISSFSTNPVEAFYFWHGGLSPEGALVGAFCTICLYMRYNRLNLWEWLDIFVPGFAFAQVIGQLALLANQANFGFPVKSGIYIDYVFRPTGYKQYDFFAPISLYQAGVDLLLFFSFILLSWFDRNRRLPPGGIFLVYMLLHVLTNLVSGSMVLNINLVELKIAQLFYVSIGSVVLWLFIRLIRNISRSSTLSR